MFTSRERGTLLAALLYWQEEIVPHGPDIARPYLVSVGFPDVVPLSSAELDALSRRLRAA